MLRVACLALTATALVSAMPIADELAAADSDFGFSPRIATANGYRAVPGAKLAHASCVHTVPSGAVAHRHPETGAWVYRDPTDDSGVEVVLPKCTKPLLRRPAPARGNGAPTQHGPAWIVDGMQENPNAFSFFSTNFTVPPAPVNNDGVLIYLWPGTETEAESDVVQPVLQYGPAGDGGGLYWIYASWYVSGDGTVLTSTPTAAIPVGAPLYGSIALVGDNYVSTGIAPGVSGSPTVLSVATSEAQVQTRAYITVEIYSLETCDQTPPSDSMAFANIVLTDGNGRAVAANFTAEVQNEQCAFAVKPNGDTVTIVWSSKDSA